MKHGAGHDEVDRGRRHERVGILCAAQEERQVVALVPPRDPDHGRIDIDPCDPARVSESGEMSGELAGSASEVDDVVPAPNRVPAQEPVVELSVRCGALLRVLRRIPQSGRRPVRRHVRHYEPVFRRGARRLATASAPDGFPTLATTGTYVTRGRRDTRAPLLHRPVDSLRHLPIGPVEVWRSSWKG